MSESPLDTLLGHVDEVLATNATVVSEADRTLSGSPYMAVLQANRADVTSRAQARAEARSAARAAHGVRKTKTRL